jgi:hypothetical protein
LAAIGAAVALTISIVFGDRLIGFLESFAEL